MSKFKKKTGEGLPKRHLSALFHNSSFATEDVQYVSTHNVVRNTYPHLSHFNLMINVNCTLYRLVRLIVASILTVIFHKVVQRRVGGLVGSLLIALLYIYWWVYCWTKFENWSVYLVNLLKLRTTTFPFLAALSYASVRLRLYRRHVRPSVCLSHAGNASKLMTLGSRCFHLRIAQGLSS